MSKSKNAKHFGTRWGFILASVGSAVGMANVWGFPNKMGQNGGGVIQLILDGTKVAEVVSDNVNAITRRTGRCPILV